MEPETPEPIVVLFVDDEKHVVESLKDAMRKLPLTILTATSGAAALRILSATHVDVVVSDELMPNMTGTELLSSVRRVYPDILRIILTGRASIEGAIRAINEGEIYRLLSKPCTPSDLAQTIFEGVRAQRLADTSRRLLQKYRREISTFEELERDHPGIFQVPRGEGVFNDSYQSDQTLEELIRQIESELED